MSIVSFKLQSSRDVLAAHRECTVQILGEVNVSAGTAVRLPLQVALVLDRSLSMKGAKLEQGRQAILACTEMAEPGDTLSLVAFAEGADVLSRQVDGRDVDRIRQEIPRIQTKGGTNIHAAVREGLKELRGGNSRSVVSRGPANRRLILATDGQATSGPRGIDDFRAQAKEAADIGVTIDTFGFGADYNEEVLAELSRMTGGNHRYIDEDPAAIVAGFREMFRQGATTGARDAVIRLTFHPRARLLELLGPSDHIVRSPREVEIRLGDLDATPKNFAVRLNLNNLEPADRMLLARGELDYLDLSSGQPDRVRAEVIVGVSEDQNAVVASVNSKVTLQTRLIRDLAAVAAGGATVPDKAKNLVETLREAGLGGTDLARKAQTLVDRGNDTKTVLEIQNRVEAGRTQPMMS